MEALVVALWNHSALTKRFLDSLETTSFYNWHVVLVDNGSSDDTQEVVRAHISKSRHSIRMIENKENLGCAKAWNQGIKELRKLSIGVIGILNNDLVLSHHWDVDLLKSLSQPEAFAICPFVMNCALVNFEERAEKFKVINSSRSRAKLQSEAMFFKTTVFDKVGLFDESFFVSFEDFDFYLRLRENGISPQTVGASVVWHQAKSSRKNLSSAHETEGRAIFVSKWGEAALKTPGFEIPRWQRRYWRLREYFGLL